MNLHVDPAEFAPLIESAVSEALRRAKADRRADESGKLLLDKREAAELLSVSVSTLDRLTEPRGFLPCVRLEGRVLYSPDTCRQWIAKCEAEGVPV